MLLEVKVKPGASRDEITFFREPNYLEIALKAKAENNEANLSLCKFLAKVLKIDEREVKIIKGRTSRKKTVALAGLTEKDLLERLAL